MKLFCSVLFFVYLCQQSSNAEDIDTRDSIKDTIEDLIKQIKDAIPEDINIPSLNIEIPEALNKYAGGHVDLSDVDLKGLKEIIIDLTYNILGVPKLFDIGLKSLNLKLNYVSDVALLNIPLLTIFGDGDLTVDIVEFDVQGNVTVKSLSPVDVPIHLESISLGDAKFKITGLLGDDTFSNYLNDILNALAPLINDNEEEICVVVENAINKFVYDLLNKNTTNTTDLLFEELWNGDYGSYFEEMILYFTGLLEENTFSYKLDDLLNYDAAPLINDNMEEIYSVIKNVMNKIVFDFLNGNSTNKINLYEELNLGSNGNNFQEMMLYISNFLNELLS